MSLQKTNSDPRQIVVLFDMRADLVFGQSYRNALAGENDDHRITDLIGALQGDTYFKSKRPDPNLGRCCNRFAYVAANAAAGSNQMVAV